MQPTGIYRQAQTHLSHTWEQIGVRRKKVVDWSVEHWNDTRHYIQTSWVWTDEIKPRFERNIKPLTRTDLAFIGSGLAISGIIITIALKTLGIAALPLSVGYPIALIGAYKYSQYRVHTHFNRLAWDHVNGIRNHVFETNYRDKFFGDIAEQMKLLKDIEYNHLQTELQTLEEKITSFKKSLDKNLPEIIITTIITHIDYLKTKVPPSQPQPHPEMVILMDLENEIRKIETSSHNFENLKILHTKLDTLETIVKDEIMRLKDEINPIMRFEINLKDSKKECMQNIEALLKKLDPHRLIVNLSPPALNNVRVTDRNVSSSQQQP